MKHSNYHFYELPDTQIFYRGELRTLDKNQKNPLLRELIGAFASETLGRMEKIIETKLSGNTDFVSIISFSQMIHRLDWLLANHEQQSNPSTAGVESYLALQEIDDAVADLIRKFRRASRHSKKRQIYPLTMDILRAIHWKVRFGWNRRDREERPF